MRVLTTNISQSTDVLDIVLKHVRAFLARNAVKPIFYAIFHADYPSETLFALSSPLRANKKNILTNFFPPNEVTLYLAISLPFMFLFVRSGQDYLRVVIHKVMLLILKMRHA